MKLFPIALAALSVFSPVAYGFDTTTHKGCQPKQDVRGCADRGAPVATFDSQTRYLIVANGFTGEGLHGYVTRFVGVGDLTDMRPLPHYNPEFPKAITFKIIKGDGAVSLAKKDNTPVKTPPKKVVPAKPTPRKKPPVTTKPLINAAPPDTHNGIRLVPNY